MSNMFGEEPLISYDESFHKSYPLKDIKNHLLNTEYDPYKTDERLTRERPIESERRELGRFGKPIIKGSGFDITTFLQPPVKLIAVEAPSESDLTDEDKQTAADIVNRIGEVPVSQDYIRLTSAEATVRFAGSLGPLDLTNGAWLSPGELPGESLDVFMKGAPIVPNKEMLVYEEAGARVHATAEAAIASALEYLSQRPAGPSYAR